MGNLVDNLPIEKFSFGKATLDTVSFVARAFKFRFIPIGRSRYQLYREDIHLQGFQGTLKECYAYLMGFQASIK